jgi:predicted dehydrogenase
MTAPIRWGILSTGQIAGKFVEDLRLLPDAAVVAVGSRAEASARAFADRYAIPRAYGDWRRLAEDPEVDAVYVATPHSGHYAASLTCLTAGKPTLTEKPFTLDSAQAQRLVAAAREHNVFLMEAMWMRCFPGIRRLRELVAAGEIGEVVALHADFGLAGPFPPTHRLRDPALGGGALLDLGVYPVAFAHLFLGEPSDITAWARLGPEGVDENTAVVLGYAGRALAALTCSLLGDTARRAVITGTTGRIELPRNFYRPTGFTLFRGEDAEPAQTVTPFPGWGYHFEAAEVHRCLRAGLVESPLVPHADTLAVMRTLDAIRARLGVSYPAAAI